MTDEATEALNNDGIEMKEVVKDGIKTVLLDAHGKEIPAKTADAKTADNIQQYADELKGLTGANWEFKDAEHSGLKKNNLRVPETPELVAKLKESGIRFGHSVKGDEKFVFVDTDKPLHLTQEEAALQNRKTNEPIIKDGKVTGHIEYTYGSKDNSYQKTAYNLNNVILSSEHFDANGRKDNEAIIKDGKITGHIGYFYRQDNTYEKTVYNEDNKPVTLERFNANGALLFKKGYGNAMSKTSDLDAKSEPAQEGPTNEEKPQTIEEPAKEEPVKEEDLNNKDEHDKEEPAKEEDLNNKEEHDKEEPAKEEDLNNKEEHGKEEATNIKDEPAKDDKDPAEMEGAEEDHTFGQLLPDNENEGKEESVEDLEAQMWNLAWKNKFLDFEKEDNKDERNKPFMFAHCMPDSIKAEKDPPPPRVTMDLESGSKLTNSSKGINLDYEGDPRPQDFIAMVQLGREKGWKSARIDPEASPEFQAEMYKAMVAMGMKVSNAAEIEDLLGKEAVEKLNKEAQKMAKEHNLQGKCEDMDARYPDLKNAQEKLQEGMEPSKAFKKLEIEDYRAMKAAIEERQAANGKEEPAKEEPAKEEPAKEEPAKEAPAKEEPAKEAPAKEAPAKEEPAKEEPAKEAPAKEEPAKEAPAKEEPAKEEPAKEEPAKEEPAKEEPAKEEPAKEAPAKEEPAKEEPAKEAPAKEAEAATKPSLSQEINGFVKETEQQLQGRKGRPLTEKQLATVDKMVEGMIEKHPDVAKDLQKKLGNGRFTPSMTLKMISNANVEIAKREAEGKTGPDMSKRQTKQPNVTNMQNLVRNKLGAERK